MAPAIVVRPTLKTVVMTKMKARLNEALYNFVFSDMSGSCSNDSTALELTLPDIILKPIACTDILFRG